MKFENFIGETKKTGGDKAVWLSNDTFNGLLSDTHKIRINEAGYLELCYGNIVVQVSMKSKFCSVDDGVSYVEVVSITEHANYTGLKVRDIFMRQKKSKDAIIL